MRNKILIALGCLLLFPLLNAAQRRAYVRRPGVVYVYPRPFAYRYYDPFWDPWYYRSSFPAVDRNKGELRLEHFDKHDDVFVNGSFAGRINDVKTMSLNPGSYNVVVRSQGEEIVDRQVYVVAGKTVKIKAGVG